MPGRIHCWQLSEVWGLLKFQSITEVHRIFAGHQKEVLSQSPQSPDSDNFCRLFAGTWYKKLSEKT
jgi:hypothetical protein